MARLRTAEEARAIRAARENSQRPLNVPRPIRVALQDGQPHALRRQPGPPTLFVAEVRDKWRVEDRWWTDEPIDRTYYELQLAVDGNPLICVFHDRIADAWYEQRVPPEPRSAPPSPEAATAVRERMEREYREELTRERRQKLTEGWA